MQPLAVIFDIGNVLTRWQPEAFYDREIGQELADFPANAARQISPPCHARIGRSGQRVALPPEPVACESSTGKDTEPHQSSKPTHHGR